MAETKPVLMQKRQGTIDDELSELCRQMRLMSDRDTDATLSRVLKVMLVNSRQGPIGGSDLSRISGLNRITVIHHLRRLEDAGLVRKQETKYVLRVQSAEEMLLSFRKDMEEHFQQMDELAREIDAHFESVEREFVERHRRRRMP